MTFEVKPYTVEVEAADNEMTSTFLEIYVKELDQHTQADTLHDVEEMTRDLISIMEGYAADLVPLHLTINYPTHSFSVEPGEGDQYVGRILSGEPEGSAVAAWKTTAPTLSTALYTIVNAVLDTTTRSHVEASFAAQDAAQQNQ